MLTESDLQTPDWLAAIASGSCVIIRGHVGEHRLEGLKAILPLGVFQWAPLELPQGEALDPEFFASIMPSQPGEVPRKIHVLPLVASTVQLDALAEVRATQPWMQWVAVVPDPEINPVLPGGILLFDAKSRAFANAETIPVAALAWAEHVLGGARSEAEKQHAVAAEGPKILATINAVSAGEYQSLPGTLGNVDVNYMRSLVAIASTIAGVEGVDPEAVAAEIEENATIEASIQPSASLPVETKPQTAQTIADPSRPVPHPQIFENGKALPIYPPGDPVGKYCHELDAVRRDPEVYGALLEMLQEFRCEDENGQRPACAGQCNDPAQKWACMRDHAWSTGMPSVIVDHWIDIFALMIARVGRKAREAYQSFVNIALQVSAANPTVSEANFTGMVKQSGVPIQQPTTPAPVKPPKAMPPKPVAPPKKTTSLPLPLKPQKAPVPAESRAQKLIARLDALAGKMEQLKARLHPDTRNASTPHPANDPLPVASATSSWEADDLENADLSLDALEKRVTKLAYRK